MPNYKRVNIKGGIYFFTVVTYHRQPFLINEASRRILRNAIEFTRNQYYFEINAWVLLPDHIHCIWTLPKNDHDFSKRWGIIKSYYSKHAKAIFHDSRYLTRSIINKRESGFWQRRFWEHLIRNESDFHKHMDYIHYNPVKHGLVQHVSDWPYSTFHRYVNQNMYPANWGNNIKKSKEESWYGE